MDLQLCLPIAVKRNNNDQELIDLFFRSKRIAVVFQLCLPIAVKGNNNDQELISFFFIKKGCISAVDLQLCLPIMPSDRCEVKRCLLPYRYGGNTEWSV